MQWLICLRFASRSKCEHTIRVKYIVDDIVWYDTYAIMLYICMYVFTHCNNLYIECLSTCIDKQKSRLHHIILCSKILATENMTHICITLLWSWLPEVCVKKNKTLNPIKVAIHGCLMGWAKGALRIPNTVKGAYTGVKVDDVTPIY